MPLDGISAYFYARALEQELCDMKVDKIQQLSRFDLMLSLRGAGRSRRLLLSANPSDPKLYLVPDKIEAPREAPMFCMLLRKHLQSGRLLSLTSDGFERVFRLRFLTSNELGDAGEKSLVFECMGRYSNLILLNQDGIILDAIVHVDSRKNRVREVLPARAYVAPPAQNKLSPSQILLALQSEKEEKTALDALLDAQKPLEKALLALMAGFSPLLIDELCYLAGIDGRRKLCDLDGEGALRLAQSMRQICEKIVSAKLSPTLFYRSAQEPVAYDFHVFGLHHALARPCPELVPMLSHFYEQRGLFQQFVAQKESLKKKVQAELERNEKLLAIHRREFAESADFEKHKEEGELILANLHLIKAGSAGLICSDFYHENHSREIALNPHRSPSWNAQQSFKRYNRLKRKYAAAAELLSKDCSENDYLYTLLDSIEHAEERGDLSMIRDEIEQQKLFGNKSAAKLQEKQLNFKQRKARRSHSEKQASDTAQTRGPRRYLSSEGFELFVGRNNLQNDKLSLKSAHKDDLWFHVQKQAGSHVILACGRSPHPPSAASIEEAAALAAWFSRASHGAGTQIGAKTAVDYCPVARLRKPNGAKPGLVVYDHYQTLMVRALAPEALFQEGPALQEPSS